MKTQSSAQTWTWTLDFDLEFVNMDIEYLEMLNNIKNVTKTQDLPLDSEIRQLLSVRKRMTIVTLNAGTRLIVKDESEILIPRKLREQMLD